MTTPGEPLLSVRGLTKRFFGIAALQSVDLAIDETRYARQQLGMRGGDEGG